jgi:glycosyltransferase involved in cell wall biosynthesis
MPQYRGTWLFAQMAMQWRARTTAVRAVHITDPDALVPLSGRKLFTTAYDLIPLKEGINRRRLIAWAGYQRYLRALRHADLVFAISNQTAHDLTQLLGLPEDRIVIARPGISLPSPLSREAAPMAPVVGERGVRKYFLFIGGPNPNKNLQVLLDAFAITRELPEQLRIVGRWLPNQLEALQRTLHTMGLADRVDHLGYVKATELTELIQGATALVVPSLDEGFGIPVGEGLAAGAVVIHSRIPVLEEVSAGSALTFDPHSAEELAACLRRASADGLLRADLRVRGAARARDLTWAAAVEKTLAAYKRLVDS